MEINSTEYQCWHEVGHAIVCLHLNGGVEFIEFIEEDNHKGLARTRCNTNPEIRQYVACGGFATEFVLSRDGFLEPHDEREFTQIVFKNSSIDREMYFNVDEKYTFSEEEDREFMNHAVSKVAPIVRQHISKMQLIVGELLQERKIAGERIKELLNGT